MIGFLRDVYRTAIVPAENVYAGIRGRLPVKRRLRYGGVLVDIEVKALDFLFPRFRNKRDIEGYEEALATMLRRTVQPGDTVVVVGGGWGVTACVAAEAVGASGKVICYEGNLRNAERTRRAAELNEVADQLEVVEAIVARDVGIYEGQKAVTVVDPEALPPCRILQLDCEGAEIDIFNRMQIQPEIVIVETHGFLGTPTDKVAETLEQKGYEVRNMGLAEPRVANVCRDNDIFCLLGIRK
ncbi:FkbM family methyltransferase [Novosphingobium aquae]|uniref:FkbM family methyltransferase n=1 Tax=Novosphingobium aquae TaxID=3133435 RepID=A0ABU8SE30_9SPHN